MSARIWRRRAYALTIAVGLMTAVWGWPQVAPTDERAKEAADSVTFLHRLPHEVTQAAFAIAAALTICFLWPLPIRLDRRQVANTKHSRQDARIPELRRGNKFAPGTFLSGSNVGRAKASGIEFRLPHRWVFARAYGFLRKPGAGQSKPVSK